MLGESFCSHGHYIYCSSSCEWTTHLKNFQLQMGNFLSIFAWQSMYLESPASKLSNDGSQIPFTQTAISAVFCQTLHSFQGKSSKSTVLSRMPCQQLVDFKTTLNEDINLALEECFYWCEEGESGGRSLSCDNSVLHFHICSYPTWHSVLCAIKINRPKNLEDLLQI